jgi:hypothetical protein
VFAFPAGSAYNLAPGGYVLIVGNLAAFSARYDANGLNIAGQYSGRLNNAGERLLLVDANTTPLHDFTYDDAWHPTTDGDGPSMVVVDIAAAKSQWNDPSGWRPSTSTGGSPGGPDGSVGLLGDLNGDNIVGLADLAVLQTHFDTATGALAAHGDLNGDGAINRADAALLAAQFGKSTTSPSPAAFAAAIVRRIDAAHDRPVDELAASLAARRTQRRSLLATRSRPFALNSAAIDASLAGAESLRGIRSGDSDDAATRATRAIRRR